MVIIHKYNHLQLALFYTKRIRLNHLTRADSTSYIYPLKTLTIDTIKFLHTSRF